MTQKEIIKQAYNNMEVAQALHEEADKMYFSAKKQLEGINSSTAPYRVPKNLPPIVAKAIARRMKNAIKKTA